MAPSTPLHTWITEVLTAAGGAATSLDVARQVWARHQVELEEGDRFYTWQVELRDEAETMATAGQLTIGAAGVWSLPTSTSSPQRSGAWDEHEIRVAVEAYVSMLRDHQKGRPLRRREATTSVIDGTGRTADVVEAMFANVSAVVQELGLDPLSAYPPRSNVPRGVRPAVREALGH